MLSIIPDESMLYQMYLIVSVEVELYLVVKLGGL